MGLFQSFNISASGMTAERFRTDIIAENISDNPEYRKQIKNKHTLMI